jgi:hypothetical protein
MYTWMPLSSIADLVQLASHVSIEYSPNLVATKLSNGISNAVSWEACRQLDTANRFSRHGVQLRTVYWTGKLTGRCYELAGMGILECADGSGWEFATACRRSL